MSYYDEILTEINAAIEAGDLDEAAFLLKKELSMPYIPSETEATLTALEKEVRRRRAEKQERGEVSVEKLLNRLKGKPQSQLSAAAALCGRNLRMITAELQDWLAKDPVPEAAALLIDALAEQEIAEEFTYVKNGIEYSFSPDEVIPVARSKGFRYALELLEDWFVKDPALFEMAKSQLVRTCYLALPLSYEDAEAPELAKQCAMEVIEAMGMAEKKQEIESAYRTACMRS